MREVTKISVHSLISIYWMLNEAQFKPSWYVSHLDITYILIDCIDLFWTLTFSSVQSPSCVWLFATPWIAARQASLSITNSRSSLRHVHRVSDGWMDGWEWGNILDPSKWGWGAGGVPSALSDPASQPAKPSPGPPEPCSRQCDP